MTDTPDHEIAVGILAAVAMLLILIFPAMVFLLK